MPLLSVFSYQDDIRAKAIAGQVVSFDISPDGLQEKMDKLTAKSGVDPESKPKEMNWHQLSDENIADQQWFTFLPTPIKIY